MACQKKIPTKKVISISTGLLNQTNLAEEIVVNMLTQQLTGPATTKWHNLRDLNLGQSGIKKEPQLLFDSERIKAAVNQKFLVGVDGGSIACPPIIQNYQLY